MFGWRGWGKQVFASSWALWDSCVRDEAQGGWAMRAGEGDWSVGPGSVSFADHLPGAGGIELCKGCVRGTSTR
jgi:hypothetical protein